MNLQDLTDYLDTEFCVDCLETLRFCECIKLQL